MTLSITGVRAIDPSSHLDQITDIHIADGRIQTMGKAPEGFLADSTLDGRGLVAAPGLVDLNVHLCEPGHTRKGDILSETRAAAAGGITSLCCSPHTLPVLDSTAVAELILDRSREAGNTKVYPLGALTKNCEGRQPAELVSLKEAGCVAFSDGLCATENNQLLRRALEYAATFNFTVIFISQDRYLAEGGMMHEGPTSSLLGLTGIPETAETVALARNLLLVEQSGVRAHFSQISSARGVEMVAQAQARGLPITADVAAYQLLLTDEAIRGFSSLYHVLPPLRSHSDREALRAAVKEGVIGSIASHHQPHDEDDKQAPFADTAAGISSVEILLPLSMTLVRDGLLDLTTCIARLTSGPAAAMQLPAGRLAAGSAADIVLFDEQSETLAGADWQSQGHNCPFIGQHLPGKVRYTLLDGKLVHSQNIRQ